MSLQVQSSQIFPIMTLTLLEILPEKKKKKRESSNHLSLTEPQKRGWQGSSQWADEYFQTWSYMHKSNTQIVYKL